MTSFRVLNRRAGALFGAATLVMGTLIPGLVAAADVTARSITLSTSVADAASVNYEVKFTAQDDSTGAFMLEFCDDPSIGSSCTVPTGFSTTSVATTGSDTVTAENTNTAVKVILNTAADTSDPVDVVLTGIHNPDTAGVFYARIVTYTDNTNLTAQYTNPTTLGTYKGAGSVAMSITDGFSVSGGVAETMTFCASGTASIGTGCSTNVTNPNLTLGSGGVLTTALSTGVIYTQISTNAAGGAVVNLKSDETGCGGLVRAGAASNAAGCGITPVTGAASAISTGDAKFGLKLGNLGGTTGTTAASGSYETTNYFMNYVSGDATGITSPYGDAIYNTSGAPVDDGTADLTFGANISNVTPAGNYSATLNLIATGTF